MKELLLMLPGVSRMDYRRCMNWVGSVRELCDLSWKELRGIMAGERGKAYHAFIHTTQGEMSKRNCFVGYD